MRVLTDIDSFIFTVSCAFYITKKSCSYNLSELGTRATQSDKIKDTGVLIVASQNIYADIIHVLQNFHLNNKTVIDIILILDTNISYEVQFNTFISLVRCC